MDRETMLNLPASRLAAMAIADMLRECAGVPHAAAPALGRMALSALMRFPETGRAHVAALLMEDNREPVRLITPGAAP